MRTIAGPTVARIPLVTHVPEGVELLDLYSPPWRGSGAPDEPLHLFHAVGDTRPPAERRVVLTTPVGTYFLDDAGELGIHGGLADHGPVQLMRTRRAGYEYEVWYARAEDIPQREWAWREMLYMHAVASRRRGVAAHACAFLLSGEIGVLCPGISGAGKSTLAGVLARDPDLPVTVLSDERAVLTWEAGSVHLWGTPWHSRAMLAAEGDAPLSAIVFVHHGSETRIRDVPRRDAVRWLLRTMAFPFWSEPLMEHAFSIVEAAVERAPALEFSYAPAPGAARPLVTRILGEVVSNGVRLT